MEATAVHVPKAVGGEKLTVNVYAWSGDGLLGLTHIGYALFKVNLDDTVWTPACWSQG